MLRQSWVPECRQGAVSQARNVQGEQGGQKVNAAGVSRTARQGNGAVLGMGSLWGSLLWGCWRPILAQNHSVALVGDAKPERSLG